MEDLINLIPPVFDPDFSIGYFDGAQSNGWCGAGMVLRIRVGHYIFLRMKAGGGTNTQVELLALWGLLWFARLTGIPSLRVAGDSLCIINWIMGNSSLNVLHLHHWMTRVQVLKEAFDHISFKHNMDADRLSKDAVARWMVTYTLKNF